MERSDPSLATSFAAGATWALADAYARYGALLYTVARNVLRDEAAAEDCVHDALMRAWRSPNPYRAERGDLRAFLVTCVRNEAMTMLRAASRRSAREERSHRLEAVRETTFDVRDHIEIERLREAMGRLPNEQRVALELAYYGNRTQAEVAAELSVPVGTVKSRISAAVRRLAGELGAPQGSAT